MGYLWPWVAGSGCWTGGSTCWGPSACPPRWGCSPSSSPPSPTVSIWKKKFCSGPWKKCIRATHRLSCPMPAGILRRWLFERINTCNTLFNGDDKARTSTGQVLHDFPKDPFSELIISRESFVLREVFWPANYFNLGGGKFDFSDKRFPFAHVVVLCVKPNLQRCQTGNVLRYLRQLICP